MATWLGHGLGGLAVARAFNMGPRGMLAGFLIGNIPDLDQVLSLALAGDSSELHRQWWSHSPAILVFGGVATGAGYLAWRFLAGRKVTARVATRYGLFVSLVLLSHLAFDFIIVNPFFAAASTENLDEIDNFLRATGRQLLNFFTDFIIYGAVSLIAYLIYRRVRRWYRVRAPCQ